MKKIFYSINKFFLNKLKINQIFSKELNQDKINILDIGASGNFNINKFNNFFSHLNIAKIIKFDEESKIVKDKNDIIYDKFLWSEDTTKKFYITNNHVSSSFYKPNTEILKDFANFTDHVIIEEKDEKVNKLDNFDFDMEINFVKIDAEGAELEILKGGKNILKNCFGFEIEQQFISRFVDSPKYFEVSRYLDELGYELMILNTESWKKKIEYSNIRSNVRLVWADFIYFLPYKSLIKIINNSPNSQIIILKYLSLLLLYNLHDEAKSTIDKLLLDKVINNEFHTELKDFIKHNLDTNFKLTFIDFIQFLFSLFIVTAGLFSSKYRTNSIKYFKQSLRKFLLSLSKIFRFKGEKNSITHDLNI